MPGPTGSTALPPISETSAKDLELELKQTREALTRLEATHEEFIRHSEEQTNEYEQKLKSLQAQYAAGFKKQQTTHDEELEKLNQQIRYLQEELAQMKSTSAEEKQDNKTTHQQPPLSPSIEQRNLTRKAQAHLYGLETKIFTLEQKILRLEHQSQDLQKGNQALKSRERAYLVKIQEQKDRIDELDSLQEKPNPEETSGGQSPSWAEELGTKEAKPTIHHIPIHGTQEPAATEPAATSVAPQMAPPALASNPHGTPADTIIASLNRIKKMTKLYLLAYKTYAPQKDRTLFFSHNERGTAHAKKVTTRISQQLSTTFGFKKIGQLSSIEPEKCQQEIQTTIINILQQELKNDKFSSTKPFSWRNHLSQLIRSLQETGQRTGLLSADHTLPTIDEIRDQIDQRHSTCSPQQN